MFTKVEIWNIGRTENGIAILLRVPVSAQCVPIYVEPHEAREILAALSCTREKPQSYTEFFAAFTAAVSAAPESMEIIKSNIPRQYCAIIHFVGKDTQFSLESQTSPALALAARLNIPIFIEETILEEDGAGMIISNSKTSSSAQMAHLREELALRVREEDYEKAADIRDRIKQIEDQMRLKKK